MDTKEKNPVSAQDQFSDFKKSTQFMTLCDTRAPEGDQNSFQAIESLVSHMNIYSTDNFEKVHYSKGPNTSITHLIPRENKSFKDNTQNISNRRSERKEDFTVKSEDVFRNGGVRIEVSGSPSNKNSYVPSRKTLYETGSPQNSVKKDRSPQGQESPSRMKCLTVDVDEGKGYKRNRRDYFVNSTKYVNMTDEPEVAYEKDTPTSPKQLRTDHGAITDNLEIGTMKSEDLRFGATIQKIDSPLVIGNSASNIGLIIQTQNNIPENQEQGPTTVMQLPEPTNNNAQSQTNIANNSNSRIALYKPEVEIHLAKVVGLLLVIFISSLISQLLINYQIRYQIPLLLVIILFYFCSLVLIELFWRQRILQEIWFESDDRFEILDIVGLNVFMFLLILRMIDFVNLCLYAPIFLLVASLIYLFFSKVSQGRKSTRFLTKAGYALQTFLIALKLDDHISWEWEFIVVPFLIYLGIRLWTSIKYCFKLLKLTKAVLLRQCQSPSSRIITEYVGIFWHFIYHGLNGTAIMTVLGMIQAFGPTEDSKLLKIANYVNSGVAAFLLFYMLVGWTRLVNFTIIHRLIEFLLPRYRAMSSQKPTRTISFIPEKKNAFFFMLSSTYFLPFEKSFLLKKRNDPKKIRSISNNRSTFLKHNLNEEEAQKAQKIEGTLESLRQYKEAFDIKSVKREVNTDCQPKKTFRKKDIQAINTSCVETRRQKEPATDGIISPQGNQKFFLSFDDRYDDSQNIDNYVMSPSRKDEEKICYLCYNNFPDAILMTCGHGGICYDCAITMINKKNECMECRKEVEAIYRIDPNPKFPNLIKTVELNKVIASTG